jgi:hypothetical protein
MARALTVCAHPGCNEPCPGPRCPTHGGSHPPGRPTTTAQGYGADWQRISKAWLAAWVAQHGWLCIGWGHRPAHHVKPGALTVDHHQPLARGGARLDPANFRARCGPCNSAKRDRPPPRG